MVTGYVEAFINGKKVQEGKNLIIPDFETKLAKHLAGESGNGIALDNLFTADGRPPANGKDGIVIEHWAAPDTFDYYALVTNVDQPAAHQVRFTGTFTNNTGATISLNGFPRLGIYWQAEQFTTLKISWGTSWTTLSLPNTDMLTIVWTITFTVY